MNVLQHTRNERNPCLKQSRPDRSYRDTLLKSRFGMLIFIFSECRVYSFAIVKILLKNIKDCKFKCNFLVSLFTWVIVHSVYFCCGARFSLRTCILYGNTSIDKKCAIRCIRHKERIMWSCIYFTDEYEYLSIVH